MLLKKYSYTIWIMLLFFILAITSCSGGGASSSGTGSIVSGKSMVTINIGSERMKASGGNRVIKRHIASIPADLVSLKFKISGAGMDTIERDVSVASNSSISESFEVSNGQQRRFSVEGFNASGTLIYQGEDVVDLSGTPVALTIVMTRVGGCTSNSSITVVVKDGSTGSVISGASVSAAGFSSETTGSNGGVTITGNAQGVVNVTVTASGYKVGSAIVNLGCGESKSIEVFLEKDNSGACTSNSSITVVVKDGSTGSVIYGVEVSASGFSIATTGSDGSATITGNVQGAVDILVGVSGYKLMSPIPTVNIGCGESKSIEVFLEKDNSGACTSNSSITVVVKDGSTGSVISGASVSAAGFSSETTGSDGSATITGNVQGTVSVNVSASGYITSTPSVTISCGESKSIEVFLSTGSGTEVLSVQSIPANPLPGQDVTVSVVLSPPISVEVVMNVVGTDGFIMDASIVTNSSGLGTFPPIPGGADGVQDTVTVSVPSLNISKTIQYVFH